MNLPRFITFTGVDEETDIGAMRELANMYPIEWGILFSPERQGAGRYPKLEFIEGLVTTENLRFAAHLCGDYSRCVLQGMPIIPKSLVQTRFQRVQVNTADPGATAAAVVRYFHGTALEVILQCRADFPREPGVTWLFDTSGGRGIEPGIWPLAQQGQLVGYAGGIGPANVASVISKISLSANAYYIDMESRIRDENDRFSIDLCRQVCETVYGPRGVL